MKRGLVVTLVLVAAAAALVTAASASHSRPAVISQLTVGVNQGFSSLDPGHLTGNGSATIDPLMIENLMTIAPDGTVKPNLAASVSHPASSTYIYTLRKGVKFWDGNEMTAVDVANSLNYYRFPKFKSASYFNNVKNIKATGRYTVQVTLRKPDATWKYVPAFIGNIFEKKFADAHPGTLGSPSSLTMGTGPWEVVSFDPTTSLELQANPHWWGGTVPIKHISIKFFSDETSEALAFRAGEVDVAFPTSVQAFATTANVTPITAPSCAIGVFSMNVNAAPWNDVHVRRAVAYAIDKVGIAKALGNSVIPLSQMIPPGQMTSVATKAQVSALYKSLPNYSYDPAKAKAELAKSAYPSGFSANLDTTPFANLPTIDQVIVNDLQAIGINVKLTSLPIGAWVGEFFGPRDKLGIFSTTSGCATPDPSWYPGVFISSKNARTGGTNIADYMVPGVDSLIDQATATEVASQRFALYSKILKQLGTDVPYVPLFVQTSSVAVSSKYTWPGYYAFAQDSTWALDIKPKK